MFLKKLVPGVFDTSRPNRKKILCFSLMLWSILTSQLLDEVRPLPATKKLSTSASLVGSG